MMSDQPYYVDQGDDDLGPRLVLTGPWDQRYADVMGGLGIRILRLSEAAGWKESTIDFVGQLNQLTGVELFSWRVKDVSSVFRLAHLTYLALQAEFTSPVDFAQLHELKVCKILWRPRIRGLGGCRRLRHLNIMNFGGEDLCEFSGLSLLARLQVTSRRLASLKGLERLAALQTLDLANCTQLEDITAITACTRLQVLLIEGCRRIGHLPPELELPYLEEVSLVDCAKIESLRPLMKCPRLRKLRFTGDTIIVDGNFSYLTSHPALRDVWYGHRRNYVLSREELSKRLMSQK